MANVASSEVKRSEFLTLLASWPRSWFWLLSLDLYPALSAAALPWSTTAVLIFMIVWFVVLLPTLDFREFYAQLARPANSLPAVLFALAVLGMFWAHDTWDVRLRGLSPVAKLVAIPFLLYHFERSKRGHWVFIAFLGSCSLLMAFSWLVYFAPGWKIGTSIEPGIPIRNYIDQNQELALCIFGLAPLLLKFVTKRQVVAALTCSALLLGFLANVAFIALARTAFLYMPLLALIFALRFFSRKAALWFCAIGALALAVLWFTSPYLRFRVEQIAYEYKVNNETDTPTSLGERLQYWRVSLASIGTAPFFGHGTGSTKELFEKNAEGKVGDWGNKIRNPHNQTLYVAIQWGIFGCLILFAMWGAHVLLFFRAPDFMGWVGLTVVVQNIVSSLLNSHLFDFHEGWLYVLGVGVAGAICEYRPDRERPSLQLRG
jgi:O-antigen ligase